MASKVAAEGVALGIPLGFGIHYAQQVFKFPGYGVIAFKICDNCDQFVNCCTIQCGAAARTPGSVYMGVDNLVEIAVGGLIAVAGHYTKHDWMVGLGVGAMAGTLSAKLLETQGFCFGGPPPGRTIG